MGRAVRLPSLRRSELCLLPQSTRLRRSVSLAPRVEGKGHPWGNLSPGTPRAESCRPSSSRGAPLSSGSCSPIGHA